MNTRPDYLNVRQGIMRRFEEFPFIDQGMKAYCYSTMANLYDKIKTRDDKDLLITISIMDRKLQENSKAAKWLYRNQFALFLTLCCIIMSILIVFVYTGHGMITNSFLRIAISLSPLVVPMVIVTAMKIYDQIFYTRIVVLIFTIITIQETIGGIDHCNQLMSQFIPDHQVSGNGIPNEPAL